MVHYIEHTDPQYDTMKNVKSEERLINIFTIGNTTGQIPFKEITKWLNLLGLDWNGIVGQSVDRAGNIKRKFNGVKALIQRECPRVLYMWCSSHRF